MGTRLSEKEINNRLCGRKIKLIDYNNFRDRGYDWECAVKDCNYKWFAALRHIINDNSGCPKCAGNIKLTNEYIDNKLIGRNIRRLENYTNINDQTLWGCLIDRCQHKWKTTASSVINCETGCPKCAGNIKITNNDIDNLLIERNIKRLGDISDKTVHTKMSWQCLIENCNYIWSTTTKYIIGNKKTGCPNCIGHIKLTNEIVDQRLIGRNIKRIDDCKSARILIWWECLVCEHKWKTVPDKILNSKSGCPNCSCVGQNEKLINKILVENNIDFEYQFNIKNIDKTVRPLRFDFYFPKYKIAIEYNGKQHYKISGFSSDKSKNEIIFKGQQERDQYKRDFCENNNITLIEIDGRKLKNNKLKDSIINIVIPAIK